MLRITHVNTHTHTNTLLSLPSSWLRARRIKWCERPCACIKLRAIGCLLECHLHHKSVRLCDKNSLSLYKPVSISYKPVSVSVSIDMVQWFEIKESLQIKLIWLANCCFRGGKSSEILNQRNELSTFLIHFFESFKVSLSRNMWFQESVKIGCKWFLQKAISRVKMVTFSRL